jgi:histidyl-tRNA synthetase
MKVQSPPGMRDFYPEDMRLQNWLFDAWRRVSRSFGFEEYEGPIFEYLDLYTLKSGEGIVSELFNFKDRGQRHFAIRPEMTPTLARMVAARANTLPRPIKWFSIPRMCRAEKPQRGRLREFYQWNVDVLGVEDPLADAEVIAVAVEFFRQIGLDRNDVIIDINSRPLAAAQLAGLGVPEGLMADAFDLIDRYDRLTPDEFRRRWDSVLGPYIAGERIEADYIHADLPHILDYAGERSPAAQPALQQFTVLRTALNALGLEGHYRVNPKLVRGLAYYTGAVYEAHPAQGGLRALMGGGRYDDLTDLLDGPRVPSTGFGMGDAPVLELLRALGRLPQLGEALDVFVIDAGPEHFAAALSLVGDLRRAGLSVDFSYKRTGVSKQFKQASTRGARYAIVVGVELAQRNEFTVKNLLTGGQELVGADRLRAGPQAVLDAL